MRASVSDFKLIVPGTLEEALTSLNQERGVWQVIAGGTDIMVSFESHQLRGNHFIDISRFHEFKGIEESKDFLTLGSLVTYTQIRNHPLILSEFPMLAQAARETGSIAIQNRGTLGGNIANASPAADSAPALLAYDAQIELVSCGGQSRWVPYSEFHTGYKKTLREDHELISRIRLPRILLEDSSERTHSFYRKVGTRKAQAISKVCFAGFCYFKKDENDENFVISKVRIALGSVAPMPMRCFQTEQTLRGQSLNAKLIQKVRDVLLTEISPIGDIRSTAPYRAFVAENLLEKFLCGHSD